MIIEVFIIHIPPEGLVLFKNLFVSILLPQGIVGNLASGKSALVHRYLTGTYVQEESPEGKPSCLSVCASLL